MKTLNLWFFERVFIVAMSCFMIASCYEDTSSSPVNAAPEKGPVVLGKEKGSEAQVWLPYSNVDSEKTPVIATQGYVDSHDVSKNPLFQQPLHVIYPTNQPTLYLSMYETGLSHSDAPTSITKAQYIAVGVREYGKGSYRLIGFGYRGSNDTGSPVVIGELETDPAGDTTGDFVVGTRTGSKGDPTLKFKVTATGQVLVSADYSPGTYNALTNKDYVDKHILAVSRPDKPVKGQMYFEVKVNKPEFFDGNVWRFSDGSEVK